MPTPGTVIAKVHRFSVPAAISYHGYGYNPSRDFFAKVYLQNFNPPRLRRRGLNAAIFLNFLVSFSIPKKRRIIPLYQEGWAFLLWFSEEKVGVCLISVLHSLIKKFLISVSSSIFHL
jgi:hypothetical protein